MNFLDSVKIKETGETGFIVETSGGNGNGVLQYLVEKDDEYKDGENDLDWFYPEEIEKI